MPCSKNHATDKPLGNPRISSCQNQRDDFATTCVCLDDAMAILAAFNCEDIEIIGITSLFGNVPVHMATENALILRDMMAQAKASAASIPVCQGSSTSFLGVEKHRIADFVHGQDGFGNKRPPKSTVRSPYPFLFCIPSSFSIR